MTALAEMKATGENALSTLLTKQEVLARQQNLLAAEIATLREVNP